MGKPPRASSTKLKLRQMLRNKMNNYEANVVRLMWVMALLGTLPPQPNLGIYGGDVKGDPP